MNKQTEALKITQFGITVFYGLFKNKKCSIHWCKDWFDCPICKGNKNEQTN